MAVVIGFVEGLLNQPPERLTLLVSLAAIALAAFAIHAVLSLAKGRDRA